MITSHVLDVKKEGNYIKFVTKVLERKCLQLRKISRADPSFYALILFPMHLMLLQTMPNTITCWVLVQRNINDEVNVLVQDTDDVNRVLADIEIINMVQNCLHESPDTN